jgi:hypothetical protein
MIDRQLQSLKDSSVPPAREDARARALSAAMAAYAAAPAAEPVRGGPRPFVLRHSYKIAASLAALAVIGPMVALLRAPEPVEDVGAKAKVARPAADMKVAPPVVLVTPAPSERAREAAPPSAVGATGDSVTLRAPTAPAAEPSAAGAPPAPPASAAPTAPAAKLATPSQHAQQAMRAAPPTPASAAKAQPKAAAADCPPGRVCSTVVPERRLEKLQGDGKIDMAAFASAIDAGRMPEAASIDVVSLLAAFDYPGLPRPAHTISSVPNPWSKDTRILHLWLAPEKPDQSIRHRGPVRLAATCGGRRQAGGQHAIAFDATSDFSEAARLTLVWHETEAPPSGVCALTIHDKDANPRIEIIGTPYPSLAAAPADIRFAIAIARFASLIGGTAENAAAFGYAETIALAEGAKGADPQGERAGFIDLMRKAKALAR